MRVRTMAAAGAALLLGLLTIAGPAQAAWTRVESERFVIYGDEPAGELRARAERLAMFDRLLRLYSPGVATRPPGRKLEIYYVQPAAGGLRRVMPSIRNAGGFYTARGSGTYVALLPPGLARDDEALFHEYAHHFMFQNFPAAYPGWFVEGFAEYFSTAEVFGDDVKVGSYGPEKEAQITRGAWIPLADLLRKRPRELDSGGLHAYYTQAWLLTHYMRSTPERQAQMNRAITAIAGGEDPVKAFETATGLSADDLTLALRRYRRLTTTTYQDILQGAPAPGLTVTTLGRSADGFLLDRLRLITADTREPDLDLLADLRRRAAGFPDDPLAQMTLARAEYAWGDADAGAAILKRLIAADPNNAEAYVQAGQGEFIAAFRDEQKAQPRRVAARNWFSQAFRRDQQDYRSLYGYAQTRTSAADFPSENDLRSLLMAYELAPQVDEIAFLAGQALIRRGRREEAALVLAKVINNPHGGGMAERARAMLGGTPAAPED